MDNCRLTIGMEATDRYQQAKNDLIKALKSCGELTPQERERLVGELFGVANVALLKDILNRSVR